MVRQTSSIVVFQYFAVAAVTVASFLPCELWAQERPRFVVEYLPLTGYDEPEARDPARQINRSLEEFKDLMEDELEVRLVGSAAEPFEYRLSDLKLLLFSESLQLKAEYEASGGFTEKFTGEYTETCSVDDAAQGKCTRASLEERAEYALGDLLTQSLFHWNHGAYRLYRVEKCRDISTQKVKLKVSPHPPEAFSASPSAGMKYSASYYMRGNGEGDADLKPQNLILSRKAPEGAWYVFDSVRGSPDKLAELCKLSQENRFATEPWWVLEHRYHNIYVGNLADTYGVDEMDLSGVNAAPAARNPL